MRVWLESECRAYIFENDFGIVACALYREDKDYLYLRQFFVQRRKRRAGIGKKCTEILFSQGTSIRHVSDNRTLQPVSRVLG
jgi:hypothetical protein